jgi:amidase
MPYARAVNSYEGQETCPSVCGPIAHNLGDIKLFVKSVLSQKPWFQDPKVIELDWREDAVGEVRSSGKLCFGIMKWDGKFMPHPPILRGIDMVADALRKAGHEVVEWEPYQHERGIDMIFSIFRMDGGKVVQYQYPADLT